MVLPFILYLVSIYGEIHGSRWIIHDYMGMWINFSKKGEVQISMEDYLRGVIDDFDEEITKTKTMTAASCMF